jgi:tetratricopeptide (TPR) repeat protein
LNDPWVIIWAENCIAWVSAWEGDLETARKLAERALVLAREGSGEWMVANALHQVGAVAVLQKDHEIGQAYLLESVTRHRQLRDRWALPYELNTLGDSYRLLGDYRRAAVEYEESLRLFQESRIRNGTASVLHNVGYVNLHEDKPFQAADQFRQALGIFQELGDRRGVAECVLGLGAVAVVRNDPERAARLFAAAQHALTDVGSVLSHSNDADYDHYLAQLKDQLDDSAFQTAWQSGFAMTFDDLIPYALSDEPRPQAPAPILAP